MVCSSTPLNQFIARHPDYFFDAPVEQARINAENLHILVSHIKCAAFELPFTAGESFGRERLEEDLRFQREVRLLRPGPDPSTRECPGYSHVPVRPRCGCFAH